LALIGVGVFFLGAFEAALRVAGYGYSTSFFRERGIGGRPVLVQNEEFGRRFFATAFDRIPAPVVVNPVKAANEFRIFLFGDSPAVGDPDPAYGPGRYLETLLSERFPNAHVELICVGGKGLNSHAAVPIARECAKQKGDFWILYLGNNEMAGPFGATVPFGPQAPSLTQVRLRLGLQQTRVGQLLTALKSELRTNNSSSWVAREAVGASPVSPDDKRREVVCRNFRENLEDIIELGHCAGAKIILNTVAVDLKDCAPFASVEISRLSAEERAKFESALRAGSTAEEHGDFAGAATQYDLVAKAFPLSADIQFRLADCLLSLTNYTAAREHFALARDYDTLPLRADAQINSIISEVGRRFAPQGLVLVDTVSLFNTNSPTGVAGEEFFFDNINLNFDGNYLLARAWAEALEPFLPRAFTNHGASMWASQSACDQRLCLTDWNRAAVLDKVFARSLERPFAGRFHHSLRLDWMQRQLAELKARLHPREFIDARFACEQAIKRRPEDFWLHQKFAEFLEANIDLPGATAEWEKVRDLLPFLYSSHYQLGRVLAAQGKPESARDSLMRAVDLRPDFGEGWIGLGKLDLVHGRLDDALKNFEHSKKVSPENFWAYYHTGKALAALDRHAEAIPDFRQAIALGPGTFLEGHIALGEALVIEGDPAQAAGEFSRAVALKPDLAVARFNLGLALLKLGQADKAVAEFKEVLRLEPENQGAKDAISKILSAQQ
jgi:tetratricopeptide (TPR) repeat protein